MELEFKKAKWSIDADGAWLCLGIKSPREVTPFIEEMKTDKPYVAKITEKRKKRSLDANAYYWLLTGMIARKVDSEPEEVYLRHVRGLGNYEVYGMLEEAVPMFAQLWVSNHLGRFIETRAAKKQGIVNVLAYYGSSDFDTVQMSRLIDHAVQDCVALGIETRSPEEVESLLAQWGEKTDKGDQYSAKREEGSLGT